MNKKKVYLAGPDVFKPNAKERGKILCEALARHDMEGLFPLDNEIDLGPSKLENGKKIYEANRQMILNCDAVLANLVPFRGPSADVGTVWECAYAKGIGKIVVGYGMGDDYKYNVIGKVPHDGMAVEDFGVWDNIMLVHSLARWSKDWHEGMLIIKDILGVYDG